MDHPNYNDHEKMLTDLKKLSMEHKFPVFLETCRQEIEKSDLIKSREMVDSFDRFDKCNYMLGISSVDPKEIPAKLKIFKNSLGKKVVWIKPIKLKPTKRAMVRWSVFPENACGSANWIQSFQISSADE